MRDVRRYAVSAASTARELADDVDLGDILCMEAIRVFRPDRFELLVKARGALTTFRETGSSSEEHKHLVEQTVASDDDATDAVIKSLIQRTFPLGVHHIGGTSYADGFLNQWLRSRRMAHRGIFSLYLERVMPDEVADFIESEKVFALLSNMDELEAYLNATEPSKYAGVLSSLEVFQDDFPQMAVIPASTVLLNLVPKMPKTERHGLFDFGDPELKVSRVVLRLLRRLENERDVFSAVESILLGLKTLSAKFSIIAMVGHREGIGHRLVSETDARKLEDRLVSEIMAADDLSLSKEWDLLHLLSTPEYWGLRTSPIITDFSQPALHSAILRLARAEVLSQGMESRAVSRRYTLHWETLERIYGNDDGIRKAVQTVRSWHGGKDEVLENSLDLADRYLSGWRPERL